MDNQNKMSLAQKIIMKMEREKKAREKELINKAKTNDFSYEEQTYMNSYNYYVFQNCLIPNIDYYVNILISQINYQYYMNSTIYKNPFIHELSANCFIDNIGFPVPERFLLEFAKLVGDKISGFEQYKDCEIDIKVVPNKYFQKGNIYKKVGTYRLDLKIGTKEKKKTR